MRKKLFALLLAAVGILSNLNTLNTSDAQEQINFKDDYRVYEPFNLSDTKKISIKGNVNLGTRETFADIGKTILDFFNVENELVGKSFLNDIRK